MKTKESIDLFFQQPVIAVAGVSRTKSKFGNSVYQSLKKNGLNVVPINPHLSEFDGDKCYNSVSDLPAELKALVVCTPPESTVKVVESALNKGIGHLWLQQGSGNKAVLKMLEGSNLNVINDRCIMMFAEPVKSVHSFHRFLSKLFGSYPK
jgi:predicted CoA-binding protein